MIKFGEISPQANAAAALGNVNVVLSSVPESRADEIKRLQKEIGERQSRLQYLVAGDPGVCVSMPVEK